MTLRNNMPSPSKRFLTFLVGFVFVFSIVSAQLPYCQCGILCFHGKKSTLVEEQTSVQESSSCCASKGQDHTPAPEPTEKSTCGDGNGGCDCPVEISDIDQNVTLGLVPVILTSVDAHAGSLAPATDGVFVSPLAGIEDAPFWRPTRGSPLPRQSLYILNSTHII